MSQPHISESGWACLAHDAIYGGKMIPLLEIEFTETPTWGNPIERLLADLRKRFPTATFPTAAEIHAACDPRHRPIDVYRVLVQLGAIIPPRTKQRKP